MTYTSGSSKGKSGYASGEVKPSDTIGKRHNWQRIFVIEFEYNKAILADEDNWDGNLLTMERWITLAMHAAGNSKEKHIFSFA